MSHFANEYEMPVYNRPASKLPQTTPGQRLKEHLKHCKTAADLLRWLDGELTRSRRNKS